MQNARAAGDDDGPVTPRLTAVVLSDSLIDSGHELIKALRKGFNERGNDGATANCQIFKREVVLGGGLDSALGPL